MTHRERLYTFEDFEQHIALPENRSRRFELIDGAIIEKAMPTLEHGIIAGNIITIINNHLDQRAIEGVGAVEARYRPPGDPHNERMPDVSFFTGDKPLVTQGAAEFMPDLVVEIQSPDDSRKEIPRRADFYLAHGVRLVVVLFYPSKRLVELISADARELLTEDDSLDLSAVLPGLSVPVSAFFKRVKRG